MLGKDKYIEFHSKFYDLFVAKEPPVAPYLSYENHKISGEAAQGSDWFIFFWQAKDYTRELLNEVNQFLTHLRRLAAWSDLLEACEEENRFELVTEVVESFAAYTISYVYAIKQRFVFASSMLLHLSIGLLDDSWQDSQLDEKQVNIKSLKKLVNKYSDLVSSPEKANLLVAAVKHIDNDKFQQETKEFRNRFHHRIPPSIEMGFATFLTRIREKDGKISYGFGGEKPLTLKKVLPALYQQHELCVIAFQTFWYLLQEEVGIWSRERPATK